jgi:SLAP domain-containing protein
MSKNHSHKLSAIVLAACMALGSASSAMAATPTFTSENPFAVPTAAITANGTTNQNYNSGKKPTTPTPSQPTASTAARPSTRQTSPLNLLRPVSQPTRQTVQPARQTAQPARQTVQPARQTAQPAQATLPTQPAQPKQTTPAPTATTISPEPEEEENPVTEPTAQPTATETKTTDTTPVAGTITVRPNDAYYDEDTLVVEVYIINGFSRPIAVFGDQTLTLYAENKKVGKTSANIKDDLIIPAGSYKAYTFVFPSGSFTTGVTLKELSADADICYAWADE